MSRRLFLPAAVLGGVAVFAAVFFVALAVHSVVADPGGTVPDPGHAWTELQGHGDDADACYVSTENDQAFELRVNGSRALRLEPNATSPNLIGGHVDNNVTTGAVGATVGGGGSTGNANHATDDYGTVGGGRNNRAGDNIGTLSSAAYATVGGGLTNRAAGSYAIIGGGHSNYVSDDHGAVCGGRGNQAGDNAGTIFDAPHNTVGGGQGNVASASYYDAEWLGHATVGGGESNTASGAWTTVGGGRWNSATGLAANVGGGEGNSATGLAANVGGGTNNEAPATSASVGGGSSNAAAGLYATVPGGRDNWASGAYSFAAGRRAKANEVGTFVWADSTDADFASQWTDQFRVRANGGARFDVNTGGWVNIYEQTKNLVDILIDTSTGATLTQAGVWTNLSDRAQKENFTPVDGEQVLASLADMPITSWNHKAEDASIRHIGPTAQDFYAAFGLGASDTSIGTLDAEGVALAAIQGLYEIVQEQDARIDALEARVAALEGGAPLNEASQSLPASMMPTGWLVLAGLFVVGGLVLVQRRRAGGRP